MHRLLAASALSLGLALPALADPNPQLVRSVEVRLASYGFQVDASRFATSTITRLHFALVKNGPYLKKRQELKTILRNAKFE